ncbi:BadM/Rrf2 family transcriptional regulator [Breznakibacter xylanolyticus]|uniref:BadM/Rrf2 family transcriptional regulator n=1 Tax=Breznakibacter xylanolyticus TaxID=990 RepID=A0A2W7NS05_9BACT|nr:Rrf2 family transcriptional regulator [Breznakibacter xylanolyticus]MBN2742887.1 Rrf2 family transcriptional regulator [Marinilabiliaceae bacterium]PZX19404.1 BadM/Rrf2 family transcriptional regulator [Breznakibacter xylanolyticus]
MLSNTCKYAIRAIIYLAINKGDEKKIGIKEISKELDIPTPFLGKILQSLAKHKLLTSTKGPHGGFGFARPVNDISLYDIVTIIDGRDLFENCLIGMQPCKSNEEDSLRCPVHDQFSEIRAKLLDLFKNETIGNIVSKMDGKLDFFKL